MGTVLLQWWGSAPYVMHSCLHRHGRGGGGGSLVIVIVDVGAMAVRR